MDGSVDPIGSVRLADLSVDTVADWSAANERVLARTTASIALLTLHQVLRFAVRRGWALVDVVTLLEPAEKPRWRPCGVDILEGEDLARLLDHAHSYRDLFTVLAFSGLRIGEALGLCWRDVDFEGGLLRVHRQWTRYREHGRLKTEAGKREVILAAPIVRLLRNCWLESKHKGADDFVFVNTWPAARTTTVTWAPLSGRRSSKRGARAPVGSPSTRCATATRRC
jgi:integrase